MKIIFIFSALILGNAAIAHEGSLFSIAHAEYWGMWCIAIGILLATISVAFAVRTRKFPEAPIDKGLLDINIPRREPAVASDGNKT